MLYLLLNSLLFHGHGHAYSRGDKTTIDETTIFHFVTRPDIQAPKWDVEVYDRDALAPGYWFLAPYQGADPVPEPIWIGPHIYDGNGELIWSGVSDFEDKNTFDFQVVQVNDEQMLSLIVPPDRSITYEGDASGVILDDSYNTYQALNIKGERPHINMHDLTVTDNGKRALFLTQKTYEPTSIQVGSFNGSCKIGWQGFKELDLETGEFVFEWDAEGHIDVRESTRQTDETYEDKCEENFDILHFNSIDKFDDGDYLVSARHSDTVYKISHRDGSIVWRLGGLKSDFEFRDKSATFTRQHHAKVRGQNETCTLISVFNNAHGAGTGPGEQPSSDESSGLLLALRTDVTPMTVDLVGRYEHPDAEFTPSRGSISFLANGNAFVGWVYSSLLSEHSFDGTLLMRAETKDWNAHSYRIYKFPWVGRPSQPPDVYSVAVRTGSHSMRTQVYVSWNGATEVMTWEMLRTDSNGNVIGKVASSPRQGFETSLSFDGIARYVVVLAIDRTGVEVGRSPAVETLIPPDFLIIAERIEAQNHLSNLTSASPSQKHPLPPPLASSLEVSDSHPPSAASAESGSPGKTDVAFGLTFISGLLIGCFGMRFWSVAKTDGVQKRPRWWRFTASPYQAVAASDDESLDDHRTSG